MKHHIIFSAILLMTGTPTYSMESRSPDRLYLLTSKSHTRSFRDELLFAHTIVNEHEIPQDIAQLILQISYHLKIHHGYMFGLDFTLLSERAFIDFLYFTNQQEITFLEMLPRIRINHSLAMLELFVEKEDYDSCWATLPQEIKKYSVRLLKPLDD